MYRYLYTYLKNTNFFWKVRYVPYRQSLLYSTGTYAKKYLIPNEIVLPFHVLELGMIVDNVRGQIRHGDAAQGAGLHCGVHHRIILNKIYRSQKAVLWIRDVYPGS
jgi:hypothetical protein